MCVTRAIAPLALAFGFSKIVLTLQALPLLVFPSPWFNVLMDFNWMVT
jgi:hypothetical protein